MKRRMICLLLCLAALLSLAVPGAAAQADDARFLYDLGLFKGSGTLADGSPDFALDRSLTRQEAVVMLVRLLGKEQEALEGNWSLPFDDVAQWAAPYVGYAYEKGLTNGISSTKFGGAQAVTATQYLTFVLRALHYDSSKHFAWNAAWEKSDEIGLTNGEYSSANNEAFDRGDAAYISRQALTTDLLFNDATLIDSLVSSGAVDKDRAIELGLVEEDDVYVLYARELMQQGKNPVTVSLNENNDMIQPKEYFDLYDIFIGSSVDADKAMSQALRDYVEACYDGDYAEYFPATPGKAGWNGDADAFFVTDGMGTIIAYGIRTDKSARDFTMYYCNVDTKTFVAERVEEMKELMASLTELDCQGTCVDERVAIVVKDIPENAAYITMENCLSSAQKVGDNDPYGKQAISVEQNLQRNIEWVNRGVRTPLPVQEVNYAEWEFANQGYTVSYWFVMLWDKDMNPLGYKMLCIEV